MERFGEMSSKHLYDIEVRKYDTNQGKYITKVVEVSADSRNQAAKVMKQEGFEVCSVNMVG